MSENKINFIIAVRGYKNVKKQTNGKFTDFSAADQLNQKVLMRIIEPQGNELIGVTEVKTLSVFMKLESYASAVLFGRKFTEDAITEMSEHNIQYVSEDYLPPFDTKQLYLAIMDYINIQCDKRCGRTLHAISECEEKNKDFCKIKNLAKSAKEHFKDGTVGLLKNDLKMALALSR
ncbi:MAG: hypothetical protein NWE92_07825 [Candidatus Bathyarchaeota archaeon]|nr:hypothetical protein [Candidatus Bathyarchaeota archaeon]